MALSTSVYNASYLALALKHCAACFRQTSNWPSQRLPCAVWLMRRLADDVLQTMLYRLIAWYAT
jgi:hypothetical protein